MRERAADLRDLENQVLRVLMGKGPASARELPAGAIVLADELLPSQLASLDRTRIAGIAMARGGATSHVAIIAASMGIPALVAAGPGILEVAEGTCLVLDAEHGRLDIDPGTRGARLDRARAGRARGPGGCRPRRGARARAHPGRRAHRGLRQPGRACRCPGGDRPRRRGLRPAAHRVPVPRPARGARRGRAGARLPGDRHGAAGPPVHDPHARHRRRQADRLPAVAARGKPGARLARRAHQPVAPGPAARAAARHPARACRSRRCASCCRW